MTLSANATAKMSKAFKRMARQEVPATEELHRILDLPRRIWEKDPNLEAFTALATRYLKTPTGAQKLFPIQAKGLQELHDMGGLYGPIPVGEGKTLLSFLAPVVLDAQRPLLVVPARLRDKTIREFAGLAQHWKGHAGLQIVSYEKLSREGGTELLQKYRPDVLIFDECHRLKNPGAAVTRKVAAWMKTFPETKVLNLTGTSTKRSMLDFAHTLRWSLPNCYPLPRSPEELEVWAAAVDEIKHYEKRMPANPGALLKLCTPVERTEGRTGIRNAVRRRIQETPGVITCESKMMDVSLNIQLVLEKGYNQRIRDLAEKLHEGVMPNGDVFLVEGKDIQALQKKWALMRTLTSGFWYDWDPRPPADWLAMRAAWRKSVRSILEQHIPGLESEALVSKAAANGRINEHFQTLYEEWKAVRSLHKWDVVPVWEDDVIIERVAKWSKHHKGLIWVSEVGLGERLEKDLGLPYFHEMGKDRIGRYVESIDPKHGSIVVSVQANGEGRNLQAWNDNLVISPPPTGTVWEQLLGRTHRTGQEADEVWVEVVIGCATEWDCWRQAMRDAKYAAELEGRKRLTVATIDQAFQIPSSDGGLW